jgi:hypothetical protein
MSQEQFTLPVGKTEFNEFADRIIAKAGQFADRDSMVWALAMELIHAPPTTQFSDEYFIQRMRKAAANQVASAVVNEIKEKQAEEAAKRQAEATAAKETVANEPT